MLAVIRVILVVLYLVLLSIFACIYCLFRPFKPNNVHIFGVRLSNASKLLGLEIEIRIPDEIRTLGPVVYIANHQNTYDLFTVSRAVLPRTVSVGKKSLKWIPFFGQMYWLTGNILIDRKNKNKAMGTIAATAEKIKQKSLSVWLFPEGTRSNGKGLLPFKTGAFRTAMQAEVPIVPICISNLHGKVKLNRWNNGKLIIEFLPPIAVPQGGREQIREITDQTYQMMSEKINQISEESGSPYPAYKPQS